MSRTALFGLEIPQLKNREWGQKILDYFAAMEVQLGTNMNIALVGDDSNGITARFGLCSITGETMVKADPSAGIWGRVVPQTTLTPGSTTLCRQIGSTSISGASGANLYDTLYHDADSDQFTIDPAAAVVADSTGMRFLPLGFAFSGGQEGWVNGLMPICICPAPPTGPFTAYKPGVNDPSGSFSTVFDSGPAMHLAFDASGTPQYIDLICQALVPSDFLDWVDVADTNAWAFRSKFKTTGDAALAVQSVIDTDGTEYAIAGVSGTSISSYGTLSLTQKKVYDAGGVFTRSSVMALRLRCSGSSSATIRVRPTALMHYFPDVPWKI